MTVQRKYIAKVDSIADYFITKNQSDNKGLSNKKLQKLLYYSQAWSLVVRDKLLFDDNIEAWIHGPAVPRVYEEYKHFGFGDINKEVNPKSLEQLSAEEFKLLDAIWDVYGKFDGDYLETLTHNELPWLEARKNLPQYQSSHSVISPKTMKSYYGQKLKETRSGT